MSRLLLFVFVAMLVGKDAMAQDPRFSQYNASPLILNPGMTGLFNGNYRVAAIYRSQWSSILGDEAVPLFRTFSGSFDMRFGGIGQMNDAFGFGAVFLSDKAGEAAFGTNQVNLSFAYHKSLSRDANHYITLGIQAGAAQRGLNYNNLRFGNQFDGEGFNPTINPGEVIGDENFMFFDVNAGLMWYYASKRNKGRFNVYAGFSLGHLNTPNQSFYEGQNADLPMKYTGTAGVQLPLGKNSQVDVLPTLMILRQGPAFEMNFGALAKIFFERNNPQGNAFYVGPYYRIVGRDNVTDKGGIASEALILAARLDYENFTLGLSYDLNFSELTNATNTRGGFEISLAYIGAFKNKTKASLCPRFPW